MKATRLISSLLTILLAYSLVITSAVKIPPEPARSINQDPANAAGELLVTEEPAELFPGTNGPYQEGLDVATKNFLKGLSGTRFEVAMSVIQTVNKAGGKVVFVGSWISGKNFVDPLLGGTSDFDMRVVFEGSPELAKAKYNQLRREITSQINQRFGPQAAKVLSSTNLYPPESILNGIDDAAEALEKLAAEGINPNLGGAITEGLWGKGAKAFRDAYEAQAGRVIWKEGNLIRSGIADLLPGLENAGIYTIEGSGNTSLQFVEKVENALKAGDTKSAAKSLDRLRKMMKKGRDLGRFGEASYLDDVLRECCQSLQLVNGKETLVMDLKKAAEELAKPSVREGLGNSLRRAKIEAELLIRWATETNPQILKVIREMLQVGSGKWTRVIETFLHYGGRVAEIGGKVRWDLALKGFFGFLVVLQAGDYLKKATQADLEGLIQNILLDATFMVSAKFVIGFVPLILKAIMDDAIAAGYNIVTAQQECRDLIAGIYEVKGRESLDVNQRTERSIEQLATLYTDESKVLEVVAVHARNASVRNDKADPEIERILNDKCGPEIVSRWRTRRIELIADAIDVLKKVESDFNASSLIANADPEEVTLVPDQESEVNVKATFVGSSENIRKGLAEFEKRMRLLGGQDKLVAVETTQVYRWKPFNLTEQETWSPVLPIFAAEKASRKFKFTGDTVKMLRFEYELIIDVKTIADDVLSAKAELDKQLTKSVPFNIIVHRQSGGLDIGVSPNPEPEKTITLTAILDDDLKKLKDLRLAWTDLTAGGARAGDSFSFTLPENSSKNVRLEAFSKVNGVEVKVAETAKTVSVGKKETKPSPTPTPEDQVIDTRKLSFAGSVPGIWDGGNNPQGFDLARQQAKTKTPGECQWEAQVHSEVWGKINPSFAPRTAAEISQKIDDLVADAKRWGFTLKVRSYAIGDFKGQFVDSSVKFSNGAWVGYGYNADGVQAYGRGWAIKGRDVVEVGYNAGGSGCWTNVDRGFLEAHTASAQAEAIGIVNSLALVEKGEFKKIPYTGPKLDGSDLPKVTFSPPSLEKLKVGESARVTVMVENAKAEDSPFKYSWGGVFEGKPETSRDVATVTVKAAKPGKFPLSVGVEGNRYFLGSAYLEYEVADYKAIIKQDKPNTRKVAVGTPVTFSAQILSSGAPASGNFVYQWQPNPEVTFDPVEGPKNSAIATFNRPGVTKVWVTVFEKKGQVLVPLAEADQIEVEVVNPELKVIFAPAKGFIGNEIKARVEVTPAELKDIDFRWQISANGRQTFESQDKREVTFIPQNAEPITVTVRARVPGKGDDLGEKSATFTADKYDVKVNVLGPEGPKPQIWREGVGLVPLEKGIAVHQFVGMRAEVTPAVEAARYEWTVNEDTHFESNNISQQIRLSRSQVGTGVATVIVRDKNGIELGRASNSFDVSVSQADLDQRPKATPTPTPKPTPKPTPVVITASKFATKLIQGEPMSGEARETQGPRGNRTWPFTLRITSYDPATGLVVGEITWPSLQSVNRVRGNFSGNTLALTETEAIKAGSAHLNVGYTIVISESGATGKYSDHADNTEGTVRMPASAETEPGDSAGTAIKQGDTLYDSGKYKEAIDSYNKALAADPNSAAAYAGRCLAKRSLQDNAGALADCNQALKLDPNNASAYRGRSMIKRGNNDLQGALYDATRAIQIDPNDYRAYLTRGLAKDALKDYAGAAADYDRSLQINPNYPNGYSYRGLTRINLGDYRGALSDLDRYISLNPTSSTSYNNRGIAKERLGDIPGAIADYEKAIALDPNNETAKRNLGIMKANAGGGGVKKESGVLDLSGERWNWFDPRADASYETSGGNIIIRAPKGNDLWPATNFDAPRLTKEVTGDFTLQTRLRGIWSFDYNGSGLTVHVGRTSVVRFERGINGFGNSGQHINFSAFVDGRETGRAQIMFSNNDLYLRLIRRGDQFTGYVSIDGASWQRVGEVTAHLPETVNAGLVLINEYNNNTFQTTFSEFKLFQDSASGFDPRPGLYRTPSSGLTYEISAITANTLRLRQWQTTTPEPPSRGGDFYNAGTATLLGDGITWRARNRDVEGYCCGNNVDFEFQFLSPTSFKGIRYRLWPLGSPAPGPNDGWQALSPDEFRLVGAVRRASPTTDRGGGPRAQGPGRGGGGARPPPPRPEEEKPPGRKTPRGGGPRPPADHRGGAAGGGRPPPPPAGPRRGGGRGGGRGGEKGGGTPRGGGRGGSNILGNSTSRQRRVLHLRQGQRRA
ncbi:MAG: tetratricopeptide repeat protein [Acidobacteria bacterium]|nr:tetratricopeptide repeat protein [Acidobacteriota bacterium]